MRTSEKFSDITIKCGCREFKVHKAVISFRSPFFEAACSDNFREGKEGVINLPTADELESTGGTEGDDPDTIARMIEFFYEARYATDKDPLVIHAKVFAAATKFQVPSLKALSMFNFITKLTAIKHGNSEHTTDIAQAIKIAHSTTPEEVTELRDALADVLVKNGELSGSMVSTLR